MVISGAGARGIVASPLPPAPSDGVKERAAFPKERRSIIRRNLGFQVPEEGAFKTEIEDSDLKGVPQNIVT